MNDQTTTNFDTLRAAVKVLPRPELIFDPFDWIDIDENSVQYDRLAFDQQMSIIRLKGIRSRDWSLDDPELTQREKELHPAYRKE